jgi:hypothetical protein
VLARSHNVEFPTLGSCCGKNPLVSSGYDPSFGVGRNIGLNASAQGSYPNFLLRLPGGDGDGRLSAKTLSEAPRTLPSSKTATNISNCMSCMDWIDSLINIGCQSFVRAALC